MCADEYPGCDDALKYIDTTNILVPMQRTKPDLVFILVQSLCMCTNRRRNEYVVPDFAIPTHRWQQLQASTRAHTRW